MSKNDTKRTSTATFPYVFRLMHWLLCGALLVLVPSGLSLYATSSSGWSIFSGVLPPLLLAGRVHMLHMTAALVFFPALLTTLIVLCAVRFRPRGARIVLLGSGLVSIISGLAMLNPGGPPAICVVARAVHDLSGLVVLPIAFLWHAVRELSVSRAKLPAAFHPWADMKLAPLAVFLLIAAFTTCAVLNGLPGAPAGRELVAARIPPLAAEGNIADLPFDKATPLKVQLAGGMGFSSGRTQLTLCALHDETDLFVLAQWDDPREDRQYMPWKRTAGGWQRQVTDEDDESIYYEDKFSLTFPMRPDWRFDRFGCAAHCHLGGGRAYGYKGSDRPVDVWHWKATRTDPLGQVDDKYWSAVDFKSKDVGRHGDPNDGGGYKKNTSQDGNHPKFLPDEFANVTQGIIPSEHAVEYSDKAAQRIKAGTIVPGIVASVVLGDRGDITCVSRHEDGRWWLYMRRKLDTGSEHDVKFMPGRKYPFGCAAFDRSSKRHAYNFAAYWLVLER